LNKKQVNLFLRVFGEDEENLKIKRDSRDQIPGNYRKKKKPIQVGTV